MLKTASQGQQAEGKKAKFDVEIASVATAVPEHKICQAEIAKRAREIFPHLPRLESLYGNTGIDNRYSVRTAGLVSSAPWMGNAYRHLPAPCA